MNRHTLDASIPVKQPLTEEYLIARRAREGVVSPYVALIVSCCAKVKRTPKGALNNGLQRSHAAGVGRAKLVGEADLTTLLGK